MTAEHVKKAARAELEQIKALGQQGTQIVAEALHRLSEFMAKGKWGPLGYGSAVEFLDAEFRHSDSSRSLQSSAASWWPGWPQTVAALISEARRRRAEHG
jgi:hypothetical protein